MLVSTVYEYRRRPSILTSTCRYVMCKSMNPARLLREPTAQQKAPANPDDQRCQHISVSVRHLPSSRYKQHEKITDARQASNQCCRALRRRRRCRDSASVTRGLSAIAAFGGRERVLRSSCARGGGSSPITPHLKSK